MMDGVGDQMVSRVDTERSDHLDAQCHLPQWCAGCSDLDPAVQCIFMGADPGYLSVSCSHYDLCSMAVRRAHCDAPKFVRVADCPPPPGKIVLVAMSRDDFWYPRWARWVEGHWEVMHRPGSKVCVSDLDLDWWMPLEPPPGDWPGEDPAVKEASHE